MWTVLPTLSLLALTTTTSACGGHDHSHHRNTHPSSITRPTRPLQWGDVNFLHTTDTHGWLLGHQKTSFPEPNYSADLGDFASFVSHMKQIALEKDVDLLLVDSGDLHDGTGLSDGFPSGGVDGHDSNEFLKKLPYDVMAIGNHELYIYANTLDMYNNFAPALNGRYLSSNVNITTIDANNNTIDVPVGERFTKFTTRKGRKVTAFGVLFDFTGNDVNTTVQKVENMVKEEWFLSAIEEEPDFFLLVGHMPVQEDNWPLVFNAIRAVHPETPIMIFGGHLHIRDCVQLDDNSMSLASGRYMETIGWMSANLSSSYDESSSSNSSVSFSRRYLDANRVTYQFHSGTSNRTFDTPEGVNITEGLNDLAERFNLTQTFGIAPEDYTISQVSYPSENSLLSLMGARVLPYSLTLARDPSAFNSSSSDSSGLVTVQGVNQSVNPFFMITNSGSLRFDIYSGEFTKNDQLTASPFADAFNFVEGVEWNVAVGVRDALDEAGEARRIRRRGIDEVLDKREEELYKRGDVRKRYLDWLSSMSAIHHARREMQENLTLGYVTSDSCPGVGDDTIHMPLESFSIPDFMTSDDPTAIAGTPTSNDTSITNSTVVDLVFVDFIQDQLLGLLNDVQSEAGTDRTKQWAEEDVKVYSTLLSTEVLGVFAEGNWN